MSLERVRFLCLLFKVSYIYIYVTVGYKFWIFFFSMAGNLSRCSRSEGKGRFKIGSDCGSSRAVILAESCYLGLCAEVLNRIN